jgi:predicted hydrolase (HD superfamily)
VKYIKLTQGKRAIIDNDDYEYINQFKWRMSSQGYAQSHTRNKETNKYKTTLMHRVINNTPAELLTDHINHNKLDNRKVNLKTATPLQNQHNRLKHKNNKSGYNGIFWYEKYKYWQVQCGRHHIGQYKNLKDAIKARKIAESQYF